MPEILQKVCMAGITGFFNAQYLSEHPNYKEYWHEGVDLAVGEKNCGFIGIKSGVSGKVIIEGDKGNYSYGCFIVIQANEKYEGKYRYYLLGHLDRTKRHKHEGDIVFPNDIVGYIGNTGHCKSGGIDMNGDYDSPEERKAREDGKGAHLHLQMYLSSDDDDKFLSKICINNGATILATRKGHTYVVNPFDYTEKRFLEK